MLKFAQRRCRSEGWPLSQQPEPPATGDDGENTRSHDGSTAISGKAIGVRSIANNVRGLRRVANCRPTITSIANLERLQTIGVDGVERRRHRRSDDGAHLQEPEGDEDSFIKQDANETYNVADEILPAVVTTQHRFSGEWTNVE